MTRTDPPAEADWRAVALVVDQVREAMRAAVAALVADGFTDEQARELVVSVFAQRGRP